MSLAVVMGSREADELLVARADALAVADAGDIGPAVTAVIDASHPCEAGTQAAVADRCARYSLPYLRLRRPRWVPGADDDWRIVANAEQAHSALSDEMRRVFLTLGPSERGAFAADSARWFLVRMRGRPAGTAPLLSYTVTGDRPPFTQAHEVSLMQNHRIDALVARNAGGTGAWPKIGAARALGLPVVMVERPQAVGAEVSSVDEALKWAETCCAL